MIYLVLISIVCCITLSVVGLVYFVNLKIRSRRIDDIMKSVEKILDEEDKR